MAITRADFLRVGQRDFSSLEDVTSYISDNVDLGSIDGDLSVIGSVSDFQSQDEFIQSTSSHFSLEQQNGDLLLFNAGVAVGGLIGLDVDERLAALRRVRERVGSGTHVHALAPGTEPRMIDALRAAPHLVDSLDVSTPERAPANGKLPDVSWTQHEIRVTEGTDSSTVRAAHSSGIALELARQLDPERFERDAHLGRDAGQTGLDAFEDGV